MPMDLSAVTRSINKINGSPDFKPAEKQFSLEETEQVWEKKKKEKAPSGDYADLCAKIDELKKAIDEMSQSLTLINRHVNATQKMLKKAGKNA